MSSSYLSRNFQISEKRKKLKKEGKSNESIPEDDPDKYKHAIYVMVMKVSNIDDPIPFYIVRVLNSYRFASLQLFADMERRRQQLDTRDQEERKRKRETEIEEEERQKAENEWQKNFEESRQNRVTSWQDFQSGSGSKKKSKKEKKKNMHAFNPPKLKPETR